MKRIISFALVLAMLLSCLPLSVFAADGTEECIIKVETVAGVPDSTAKVSVVVENNPGILGATLKLSWDAGLTLTSVERGEAFSMLKMTKPNKWQTSGGNYIFYGEALADDEVIDGSILDLTFEIDAAAEFGTSYGVRISYESGDIFDKDLNLIDPTVVNGGVDITYLPGDVNGDKRINALDLTLLCRFIADGSKNDPNGYNTNINELAGDVDANGRWNALDLTLICRYIADGCTTDPNGYNVELKRPDKEHTHRMTATEAKAATCTEDGNIAYWYCTGCSKYFSDEAGANVITIADTVIKGGHTLGDDATCTEAQICTVCGEVLKAANGHIPDADATCTKAQICTVCKEVLVPAKGHTPGADATCTKAQACTVCDEVLTPAKGHSPGADATCTEAQECTVCGEVLKAATGHTYSAVWSSNESHHWHVATCEHSNEISGNAAHTFNASHACTVCDYDKKVTNKLATPVITNIEYDTIYWDPVENAKQYTVIVNDNYTRVVSGTSCELSDVFWDGKNISKSGYVKVKVRANGYNNEYFDSNDSALHSTYYYIPETEVSEDHAAKKFRIGHGYNLIEAPYLRVKEYASTNSVLNINKLFTLGKFNVLQGTAYVGAGDYYESIDDFLSKSSLDVDVGFEVGCSLIGSVKTQFGVNASVDYSTHLYNCTYVGKHTVAHNDYYIGEMLAEEIQHCLSDNFKKETKRQTNTTAFMTDEMLAKYLYENYGTHVILGVKTGGEYVSTYTIQTNNKEIAVDVKLAFETSTGGGAIDQIIQKNYNISAELEEEIEKNSSNTKTNFITSYYGGSGQITTSMTNYSDTKGTWSVDANNASSLGFTKNGAIAISSLIRTMDPDLAKAFDDYINSRADEAYKELYSQYTSPSTLPLSIKTIDGENILTIDLSSYQSSGNIDNVSSPILYNGVLSVSPIMLGKRIDKIIVNGAFANDDADANVLIDSFSIALTKEWKRNVDVVINNLGVICASENGLVDKTKTNGINVNVSYNGINFVDLPDGTKELHISTDANTYNMAFDLSESESLDVSTVYMDGSETVLPVAEKTGYSFAGWLDANNNKVTDKQGALDENYVPAKQTILHPDWTRVTYEITLNSQNASEKGTETIYEQYDYIFANSNGEKIESIALPVKPGYSFEGYYLSVSENSTSLANGETEIIDRDGNISVDTDFFTEHDTVYALWKPVKYTISLYSGDELYYQYYQVYGEGVYNEMMNTICKVSVPTKDGYTFDEFKSESGETFIDKDGNILAAINGNYKTVYEDTSLYADWKAKTYTITFDANKGSCNASSIDVTYGKSYGSLPTPTRTGYTFNGWFTAASGGTKIEATSVVSTAKDHTLYAQWAPYEYIVEYNANGGTGATASSTHTYDVAKALTAYGFSKTGYTFGGWNTKPDGTGKTYLDKESVTNLTTENGVTVTLYAMWNKGKVTVQFNANGGSVSTSSNTVTYSETYGSLPTPTRAGYTFDGWFTAASGGTKISAETTVLNADNHTLYAQWTLIPYTVTWSDPANATITVKRTSSPNGKAATGTISSGAKIYYGDVLSVTYSAAAGYSIASKGATSITVTGNVTSSNIYATATLIPYTVTWSNPANITITVKRTSSPKANAATGTLSSGANIYYGDVLSVTYSVAAGHSIASKGATSITVTGNVTSSNIYATAKANSYTVTFNANGGSVSPTSKTVTYGNQYGTLPTPTRNGYAFGGWYLNGNRIVSTTTVETVANHTVTAQWTPISHSCSFAEYKKLNKGEAYDVVINTGIDTNILKANGYSSFEVSINWNARPTVWTYINNIRLEIQSLSGTILTNQTFDNIYATGMFGWDYQLKSCKMTISLKDISADGKFIVRTYVVDDGGGNSDGYELNTDNDTPFTIKVDTTAIK